MWKHGVPNSRLTVIKQVEDYIKPNGQHIAQWLCECNCKEHKQLNVRSDALEELKAVVAYRLSKLEKMD